MCHDAFSRETPGVCSWWRNCNRRRRQRYVRGVTHGVLFTPGSAPPPFRNGFVPRRASWGPAWTGAASWGMPGTSGNWSMPGAAANWGTPGPAANWGMPAAGANLGTPGTGANWGRTVLPARQPDHNVWSFPTGNLTWSPNPNGYTYWFPGTGTHIASPWPPTDDARPKFAPWLAQNPFQPDMPMLQWDVRQHPLTTRLTTGAHISTNLEHAMRAPATDPPVSIIEIIIQAGSMAHLWNIVRVQRTGTIKVVDILNAIYEWLQTPLTEAEIEHIERVSPASVEAVFSAFHERSRASPALRGWEHLQGPRRIDCLGDVRRWMGLSYSPTGQGMQLVLNLQTIPRPI